MVCGSGCLKRSRRRPHVCGRLGALKNGWLVCLSGKGKCARAWCLSGLLKKEFEDPMCSQKPPKLPVMVWFSVLLKVFTEYLMTWLSVPLKTTPMSCNVCPETHHMATWTILSL
jgi:hypothetical protein